MSSAKWSWPAGTAVCVVKTVLTATASSAAREVEALPSSCSRMRSSTRNAAWPSLMCHTVGCRPTARERAHAADAEHDLLLDARGAVAAVEPVRDVAVARAVVLEVGVEQVERTRGRRCACHTLHMHSCAPGNSTLTSQLARRPRASTGAIGRSSKSVSEYIACCLPSASMVCVK